MKLFVQQTKIGRHKLENWFFFTPPLLNQVKLTWRVCDKGKREKSRSLRIQICNVSLSCVYFDISRFNKTDIDLVIRHTELSTWKEISVKFILSTNDWHDDENVLDKERHIFRGLHNFTTHFHLHSFFRCQHLTFSFFHALKNSHDCTLEWAKK